MLGVEGLQLRPVCVAQELLPLPRSEDLEIGDQMIYEIKTQQRGNGRPQHVGALGRVCELFDPFAVEEEEL